MVEHVDTESNKRTLRTIYQAIVGLLTTVPVIVVVVLQVLPADLPFISKLTAVAASAVAGVTAATKLVTTLEAVGFVPNWLTQGELITPTESTKRTLRTAYQGIVSLLTSGPLVIASLLGLLEVLPFDVSFSGQVVLIATGATAGLVIATKILTTLEDRGVIPAWLREPDPSF